MRRNLLLLAAVSMMLCFTLASTTVQPILAQPVSAGAIVKKISGEEAWEFCDYLASPEFEGRLAGDTGQYEAGDWIADQFEGWGLEPLPEIGGYKQWFTYEFWHAYAPVDLNWVDVPKTYEYGAGKDYAIFSYSGSGDVTAEVVFVGYGITWTDKDYDDYAGVDVEGKIVLVMCHGPNHVMTGWHPPTWFFGWKAWNARMHGAIGFILVLIPVYAQCPLDPGP